MGMDKITQQMYDNRRPCPHCGQPVRMLNCAPYPGVPHVEVRCKECQKTWVLKTPLETIKNRPTAVKISSSRNAIREWNQLAENWRALYWLCDDGGMMLDMDRDDDGTPIEEIGRYEVVFDYEGQRYYCYIDAVDIDEAMEMFWRKHPDITTKHVVDTLEV